jgi:hypothetical protein
MCCPTCRFRFVYNPTLLSEIASLYFRKIVFGKVLRYAGLFVFLIIACVDAVWFSQGETHYYLASVYALLACGLLIVVVIEYKYIMRGLRNAYGLEPPGEVEYYFDHNRIIEILGQRRAELLWAEVKKVWITKNIVMVVSIRGKCIALPHGNLNAEQKAFLFNKAGRTRLGRVFKMGSVSV